MQVCVRWGGEETRFEAGDGERLLFAGLRQGIALPYGCASGTCGECLASCVDGTVMNGWSDAPGLVGGRGVRRPLLLCQDIARSSCVIELPGLPVNLVESGYRPDYVSGRINKTLQLTDDVLLVTVALEREVAFAAGQFMMLGTPGVRGFRAYSIVENQATDGLSFIVKLKPGGKVSQWISRDAVLGTDVRLFGPLGRACFQDERDGDIQVLAGASGVSMALSVLERARDCGHLNTNKAHVIFGVRSRRDLFFVERLVETGADVTIALSDEDGNNANGDVFGGARVMSGFVHEVIGRVLPTPTQETVAFLAGPPGMIDCCLRELVMVRRMAPTQLRYDRFT